MSVHILDHRGDPIIRPKPTVDVSAIVDRFKQVHGRYDAAGNGGDLDKYWANADGFDADSANSPSVRQSLTRRSRYEVANNGLSDGISQTYATDLVGTGPQLRMQTGSQGFNQLVERTWFLWCQAIKFRRKLWTMAHAKHVDGEALAIIGVNRNVRHQVQLDISLRETEQCATPLIPLADPNYIDGIKCDDNGFGDPVYYDFLKSHPGSSGGSVFNLETTRVPANRVLHWFKMRRPGQHRGVPECASTLNLGAAFRRLREATLSTAEKVAAWTLLLKTLYEPEEIQTMPAMSQMDIVHGMMTALPNAFEPHQLKAEQPGPQYDTFYNTLANEQGRPKNMPLNKVLCNSANYNYASGRLDHQTYYGNLDVDREDGNDSVLDPLFDVWFDFAIARYGWLGGNPSSVSASARFHLWDWPKHRVADVQAEAGANETKLKSGQIFIHHLFSDAGMDFEDEAEAAAQSFGVDVKTLKQRLFDVLFPPPKSESPQPSIQEPALAAILNRALQLPGKVNGNGAHHAN